MANLKYYAQERARYGEMGAISAETAKLALDRACVHFNLNRVRLEISKRKKRTSRYTPGLGNLYPPTLRPSGQMAVPTISMATTMMTWLTLVHELAHHMHSVRFTDRAKRARPRPSTEHWHGPAHRGYVQQLVNYFVDTGMITVKPAYAVFSQTVIAGWEAYHKAHLKRLETEALQDLSLAS